MFISQIYKLGTMKESIGNVTAALSPHHLFCYSSLLMSQTAVAKSNKPGGTVQKSTVYLGSEHLGLSFLTSLNHQLFKNIAYVGYFCHFVICCICVLVNLYSCICICVYVYLTVQNIMFDVLGPLAFQKI